MFTPSVPNVNERRTGLTMGDHCELMVKQWNISREAQDQLALASHLNGARAYEQGFYDDLLVPFNGLKRDNNLRADTRWRSWASSSRHSTALRATVLDRRQFHAADRWRRGGAALVRSLGQGALAMCRRPSAVGPRPPAAFLRPQPRPAAHAMRLGPGFGREQHRAAPSVSGVELPAVKVPWPEVRSNAGLSLPNFSIEVSARRLLSRLRPLKTATSRSS